MAMTGDHVELRVGTDWIDVTGDVYERDPIAITRGVPDHGTSADPGRCTLTLNNRDGKYSPRNPMSPYYGSIGRNTPLRVSVPADSTYLSLTGSPDGYATTPHTAAMDVVNGFDVRVDAEVSWYARGPRTLVGRLGDLGNRSFLLLVDDGALRLSVWWGTTSTHFQQLALPAGLPARSTMRATYTENVGAGTWTTSLYWGESITGPWHALGDPATNPMTTPAAATTAPFTVAPAHLDATEPRHPAQGRFYRAQLRDGVNGAVVVDADFSAQSAGAAGFTDSVGLPWSLVGAAELRDRADRFVGEVSVWPPRWDLSGADAWSPVEASGILRRLGQGAKPLDSALRRRIPTSENLLAYWPMEDGADADQAASPIAGVRPLSLSGVTWSSADSLPSSLPLPVLASNSGPLAEMYGPTPAPFGTPSSWLVRFVYRLDTAPTDGPWTMMRILSVGGTVREWYIQSKNNLSRVIGKDADGSTVFSQDIGTGADLFGQWTSVQFRAYQSGGSVEWRITWQDIGGDAGETGASFSGSLGRVLAVASPPDGYASALDGMALGHIAVFNAESTDAYEGAITGYQGETAINRARRLAVEEDMQLIVTDADASLNSEAMGPQRPNPLLDLLTECADVDGGILHEDRDRIGLVYRDRSGLYNQDPVLTLDYSAGELWDPFEPTDDDSELRNDVTVTRDGGSSARAVRTEGSLSINPAPDGVGTYGESLTQNLADDTQPEYHANWRLHLGTWDEARYPSVTVLLHAAPQLVTAATRVQEGDKIRITNLPMWVAPGDVELLVDGYSETIRMDQWEITYTCRPAGPYNVGTVEDDTYGRVDTDGSHLTADVTSTVAALPVITDTGKWITSSAFPADFPFDVNVGGEVATVSGIVDRPTDDFTRTVSNGWGTAASGFTWSRSGGSSFEYAVNGSSGTITVAGSFGAARFMQVLQDIADCELLVAITPAQLAAGDVDLPGVMLRASGAYYRCRLILGTSGSVGLDLVRISTLVGTAATTSVTYTAGTKLWLRVRITGQQVDARVWQDGSAEPGTFQLTRTVTTSPIASGAIGLTASVGSGSTNTSPSFAFDDFTVVSPAFPVPQFFTVTRSVNGISKAHAAGTDIRLADPTYVAL